MKYLSLDQIKDKVDELASIIDVQPDLHLTYGTSRDFAYPHIEVDSYGYHFVVVERGQELERKITDNLDDLLYWIFEGITFSMASDYELEHRIEEQDSRILLFKKQIELMRKLSPDYAERLRKYIDGILRVAPYTDPPKFD